MFFQVTEFRPPPFFQPGLRAPDRRPPQCKTGQRRLASFVDDPYQTFLEGSGMLKHPKPRSHSLVRVCIESPLFHRDAERQGFSVNNAQQRRRDWAEGYVVRNLDYL
jgi:hypothetical protein